MSVSLLLFCHFVPCEDNRQPFNWLQKKGRSGEKENDERVFVTQESTMVRAFLSAPNKPLSFCMWAVSSSFGSMDQLLFRKGILAV